MDTSSTGDEEDNGIRLYLLLQTVAPKAVGNLFHRKAPSKNLNQLLQKNITTQIIETREFDITLMICLLRNLNLVKEPYGGFDRLPGKNDESEGADLARIKYYRNDMAHSHKTVTQIDFEIKWIELANAINRLTRGVMKEECDHLKAKCLDKNIEKLKAEVECFKKEISDNKESIEEVRIQYQRKIDDTRSQLTSLINLTHQSNIRQLTKEIDSSIHDQWVMDDKRFVETSAVKHILQQLKKDNIITITGVSGIGKTTILRHVALRYERQGYSIVPVKSPLEIVLSPESRNPKIFVIDDTCGESAISLRSVDEWLLYESEIKKTLTKRGTKIIASSILHIFNEKQFQNITLLSECACNLSDKKNERSFEEDVRIMANYISMFTPGRILPLHVLRVIHQRDISKILPFIFLFSNSDEEIKDYLTNPKASISNKIGQLKEDRKKYCALFIFLVTNGCINDTFFHENQEFKRYIENIFEDFDLDCGKAKRHLKEKLEALTGTYVMKSGSNYVAIHAAIFDALCDHFCTEMLEKVIKYAGSKLTSQRLYLQSVHQPRDTTAIIVPEKFETIYFDKVTDEMMHGNLCDLLRSRQMTEPLYRMKLKSHILKLDYQLRKQLLNMEDKEEKHTSLLYLVCQSGYIDFALLILDNVDDINSFTHSLPMNAACSNGFMNIAKLLIVNGCDVTQYDRNGLNSLLEACKGGYINITKLLLKHGANINERNIHGETSLMMASGNKQTKTVKFLISEGGLVNECSKKGTTPLMYACFKNDIETVKLLLSSQADVNISILDKWTPLMIACQDKNLDMVELLIANGADVNCSSIHKTTPLMIACGHGNRDIATKLIQNGARPDEQNQFGGSALHTACAYGQVNTVELLLKQDVDINKKDEYNMTPLAITARNSNATLVTLLLQKGAKTNTDISNPRPILTEACLGGDKAIVDLLIENGAQINHQPHNDMTPLMAACFTGNEELVNYLIDRGAKVNETNDKGWSALFSASTFNNIKVIKLLIENEIEINVKNHFGITPLMLASFYENIAVVGLLKKHGGDLLTTNKYGHSILTVVSRTGSERFLKWIIDNMPDTNMINQKDFSECTPLMHACSIGHLDKAKRLIEKGANINIRDINGWTSLMWAAEHGNETLVDFLIQKGQSVDDIDNNGCSALSIASYVGNLKTIELLLLQGAGVNHSDRNGWTPLMWACRGRHEDAVKLLLDYEADINIQSDDHQTPLIWACDVGEDKFVELIIAKRNSETRDYTSNIWVLLMWSAKMGKTETVHDCIRRGVDVNKANNDGITPLIVATFNAHYEIVRLLVRSNALVTKLDNQGWSALRWAAQLSLRDIFVFLLFNGACITGADWLPMLLLSSKKRSGFTKLMYMFIEQGVDLNCVDDKGRSPLFLSCIADNYDLALSLIENGADLNQTDNRQRTPIMEIFLKGNIELFHLFMKYKANILLRDFTGNRCLHEAVKGGQKTIVSDLIENGVDITSANKRMWTAWEEARWRGYTEIVKLIESKLAMYEIFG